ncbi:VTT domain-containing protein [Arcanobacterium haemolyticum]|nr:VTT domain-containing protein [Arcanobacterium haemolyticum]
MSFLSDPELLLSTLGAFVLPGLALILFVESGLLFPFLPGDSLIFTAAMLHTQFGFSIWTMLIVGILAAFLGVQVGYWIGAKFGRRLFKDDARILKTEYLNSAEAYFEKHGAISLVLSRFVPIVRTFVPIAAGAARMNYPRFVFFNMVGALAWLGLMTGAGLLLGQIPFVANNIDIIAIIIVLVSVLPILISFITKRVKAKKAATELAVAVQETATSSVPAENAAASSDAPQTTEI